MILESFVRYRALDYVLKSEPKGSIFWTFLERSDIYAQKKLEFGFGPGFLIFWVEIWMVSQWVTNLLI